MQHRPQVLTILCCTAVLAAILLAETLRAVAMPSIYVVFVSVVLSVFMSLVVVADLVIARLERPKR